MLTLWFLTVKINSVNLLIITSAIVPYAEHLENSCRKLKNKINMHCTGSSLHAVVQDQQLQSAVNTSKDKKSCINSLYD